MLTSHRLEISTQTHKDQNLNFSPYSTANSYAFNARAPQGLSIKYIRTEGLEGSGLPKAGCALAKLLRGLFVVIQIQTSLTTSY